MSRVNLWCREMELVLGDMHLSATWGHCCYADDATHLSSGLSNQTLGEPDLAEEVGPVHAKSSHQEDWICLSPEESDGSCFLPWLRV